MKKLIAILLATVMIVAMFAACGGDETGTSSGTKKPGKKPADNGITLDVEFAEIGDPSKKADAKVPEGGKHIQTLSVEEKAEWQQATSCCLCQS